MSPVSVPFPMLIHSSRCKNIECRVIGCGQTKDIILRIHKKQCNCTNDYCKLCKLKETLSGIELKHPKQKERIMGASDDDNCVICLEYQKTHIYGCGHQCVCSGCLVNKCPVCRFTGLPFRVFY